MKKIESKTKCTGCFKSLGISSRMEIYQYLSEKGKAPVSELVNFIKLKQPTVSYHLKEMKQSGLLFSEKIGKEVFYGIKNACPHYKVPCVMQSVKFPSAKQQVAQNA